MHLRHRNGWRLLAQTKKRCGWSRKRCINPRTNSDATTRSQATVPSMRFIDKVHRWRSRGKSYRRLGIRLLVFYSQKPAKKLHTKTNKKSGCCWDCRSYCVGNFGSGSLRAQGQCIGVEILNFCTVVFLRGHFLFTFSVFHFCCRMYRLATMHSVTDR